MASEEVIWGDWVLRLDGNVIELLYSNGRSFRYHVNHVAVEAKPSRNGLSLRLGTDVDGKIVDGATLEVPNRSQAEVERLFAEARKRRDARRRPACAPLGGSAQAASASGASGSGPRWLTALPQPIRAKLPASARKGA